MTPLLLVPGLLCDARMWGPIPQALAPRPIVHAPPTEGETIPAMAAAILRAAPDRFALAGLSMGGIVALEMLAQAPARIERVALMDTTPLAEAPAGRVRRDAQIARALGGDLAGVVREELAPLYLAPGAEATPEGRAILALCLDMALGLGPQAFARQARALRDRQERQAALAAFPGFTLVLTGAHDRLCPRDRHALMAALAPRSRLAVIAAAGHLPTLERPEETAEALRAWLEADPT